MLEENRYRFSKNGICTLRKLKAKVEKAVGTYNSNNIFEMFLPIYLSFGIYY